MEAYTSTKQLYHIFTNEFNAQYECLTAPSLLRDIYCIFPVLSFLAAHHHDVFVRNQPFRIRLLP